MGVVDLARRADGTEVALKRLTLQGSTDDIARARQRIEREADVLTRLDHPNIVELLEVLDDGDEVTLVMAYLTGGTLAERVAKHGPLPADEVERLADALGSALADAHRAGVVHRDIKPGNVLFDAKGVPHLADFGVASSRDDTAGLTVIGTVVGTPGFMAPEQARGEGAGPASDVFALGATLLYAATGEGPYGRAPPSCSWCAPRRARCDRSRGRSRRRCASACKRCSTHDPRSDRRPPRWSAGRRAPRCADRSGAAVVAGRCGSPAAALAVAALLAGVLVSTRETGDPTDHTVAPSTTGCTDLPYQPCGVASPAPGTDGRGCLAGFEDYDADAANGCEAADDGLADDATFPEGAEPIEGTIVPRDDVDTFAMAVGDGSQLLCDGRFTVRITAPEGMTLLLEVLDEDEVLGQTTSAHGVQGTVTLREEECFVSDARTLTARVSAVGNDRSGATYRLERSGSF